MSASLSRRAGLARATRLLRRRHPAHALPPEARRELPPPRQALLPVGALLVVGLAVSGLGGEPSATVPARSAPADNAAAEPLPPLEPGVDLRVPEVRLEAQPEVRRGGVRLRSVSTAASRPRVPSPDEAEAAPQATPAASTAQPAQVLRPALRLPNAEKDDLEVVLADADVTFATTVHVGELRLAGGRSITVGVVEPRGFRVVAPQITADSDAVWQSLARGELLLSHDRAGQLRVGAGDDLVLESGATARVGGAASNGAPPLVDAIATWSADLDLEAARRTVLVAVRRDADVPAVAHRLEAATGTAPHAMPAPWPAVASLVGDDGPTVEAFEPFSFRPARGGRITIDPAWEAAHIVETDVPILGTVRCHRLILPQLHAALQQIVDEGLADLLDPGDYGGCYLPRHIDWNAAASLSMHAWGVALDVNVSTNGLGQAPKLDRRIVEVFEDHGFAWGGHWSRPDGMHFELERLLDVG